MDNEESSIIVGQEIPITTGESLGTNNSNPFDCNSSRDWNWLSVKPQINEGNSIKLDIEQEVSYLDQFLQDRPKLSPTREPSRLLLWLKIIKPLSWED